MFDELMATGAVVVGRRTFGLAGGWDRDHHGVPVFVLIGGNPTSMPSGRRMSPMSPTGSSGAMSAAKQAAGGKNVHIMGSASVATRRCGSAW